MLQFFTRHPWGIALAKAWLLTSNSRQNYSWPFARINSEASLYYLKMLRDYSHLGHLERIRAIRGKVHILIGEKTSLTVKKNAREIAACLKQSVILKIKKSKHFPLQENPQEVFQILSLLPTRKTKEGKILY